MAEFRNFFNRPMPPRDYFEKRQATQIEIFFDLVSVIAIASLTASFHHSISHGDGLSLLPRFLFVFLAIWWPWMNYTWFASGWDNRDGIFKILTGVIMFGYLIFAGGTAQITETMDFGTGLFGWIIMRAGMILLWLRAAQNCEGQQRKACYVYAFGLFSAQAIWVFLYFAMMNGWIQTSVNGFLLIGAIVYFYEFAVPFIASRFAYSPFNFEHIIERFGLLNMIVMGEVLLAISFAFGSFYEGHFSFSLLFQGLWLFIIVFLMWWIYFVDTKEVVSENQPVEKEARKVQIWGFFHIIVFFSSAFLGATMAAYVDYLLHENHMEHKQAIIYVAWPIALYLIGIWIVREQFRAQGKTTFILPIAAVLILISSYLTMPVWVFALILAGALVLRVRFTPIQDLNI